MKPDSSTIIIRQATVADLPVLYVFEQGVISAERPFDSTLKNDPVHYYDLAYMIASDDVQLVVATDGDKVIASGYARIEKARHFVKHDYHAYLGFMYVLPEYRGRGINKLVIDALKDWSRARNVFELTLEVYFQNEPAIRAYDKIGFIKHMIEMRLPVE
jgi:ribosomal protein S18 acetylase RimI-like enzyme